MASRSARPCCGASLANVPEYASLVSRFLASLLKNRRWFPNCRAYVLEIPAQFLNIVPWNSLHPVYIYTYTAYIYMYMHMQVCIYIYVYVCVYVYMCIYICICVYSYVTYTHACKYAWVDGWVTGSLDVWMYGYTYVCMHVRICVPVYPIIQTSR